MEKDWWAVWGSGAEKAGSAKNCWAIQQMYLRGDKMHQSLPADTSTLLPFLLSELTPSVSSLISSFGHLCNFLAQKDCKGYLYNAELMLLISSCSSHMQIF